MKTQVFEQQHIPVQQLTGRELARIAKQLSKLRRAERGKARRMSKREQEAS